MRAVIITYVLSSVFGSVTAWGAEGHQAVGYIAMQFLAPKALSFVQSSLDAKDSKSLGPAATWADSVKHTVYPWSSPYHFIDANDSPLSDQCSVDVRRDSSAGNTLLNAISNYTSRVQDTSLDAQQRQEALKFLDHFIGDIGQPLHVEAYKLGGNEISVHCGRKIVNLHAAWDTDIIQTMLSAKFGTSKAWADNLATSIKSGAFKSSAATWIKCSSTSQPASQGASQLAKFETIGARSTIAPLACPLVWAQESNTYDCSAVFSFQTDDDLCQGIYFDNAVTIINEQISKQGYRLAAWLNQIFDGKPI